MAAHVELRFVRNNSLPAGTFFQVYWSGVISNGVGRPDFGPPNKPLSQLIPVWPEGKAGDMLEPDMLGVDMRPCNAIRQYGDMRWRDMHTEDMLYNDVVVWSTREVVNYLRDGSYTFRIAYYSAVGNWMVDPNYEGELPQVTVFVIGNPMPPSSLRFFGWVNDVLRLAWSPSPEFV